ncbi:MAG TPA: citrate/2-methylcitrate synthase [Candidatus Margulisiibacteriota bacterium]|nr:citrate/2-methylcitrate synthase [Candidatus Margulisiibacteriota bacterium]
MTITRGLEGVVVTETRLSDVDGERGRLVIGGVPVEELAPQACFEDVLFLLWHDRFPTADEQHALHAALAAQRSLPAATVALLRAAALRRVPCMEALRMGVATLSATDPSAGTAAAAGLADAIGLVARFPTVVATYWRLRHGREPIAPDAELGHAANYLYMLSGTHPDVAAVRALETYLTTVIDHGMNASTFTARVIASTRSDMVSALVGAIGALKGPLHGGAPGPALDMVFEIQARAALSRRSIAEEAEEWIRAAVTGGARIMGFGHRVYKVRDPRAEVLAAAATRLFDGLTDARLYADARCVEEVVLRVLHELKPGRRLETNVEFYTALLLHGIGFESELFTPTFAIARAGGWTAHVLEQAAEDRLIRPAAAYVGERDRHCPTAATPAAPATPALECEAVMA